MSPIWHALANSWSYDNIWGFPMRSIWVARRTSSAVTLGSRPARNGSPCIGWVPGLGHGIPGLTSGWTIAPAASNQRAGPAESSSKVRYHRSTSGTPRVRPQNWRTEAARALRAAGSCEFHAK